MNRLTPLTRAQRVLRICLFLLAIIAVVGGILQMSMGEPNVSPRLDNIHRFMAGIYLGCGLVSLWTGITIRQHRNLILIIALAVSLGAFGRIISMSKVGTPEPAALWITYCLSEIIVPFIMVVAWSSVHRNKNIR
jgi:general stress protein CsbA